MSEEPEALEQLPPYVIEGARSSRSKCKTCRRTIDKGTLRIGMLIEGPFGPGHVWHHLRCAARRQIERVEEAYELEAWKEAKQPPPELPGLDELRKLSEEAEERRKTRREPPYAEIAPSGRSKCKHCGEPIPKDELRVVLAREVTFGRQVRTTAIAVLPEHVAAEMQSPDCATGPEGFEEAVRTGSQGLDEAQLERLFERIGRLG